MFFRYLGRLWTDFDDFFTFSHFNEHPGHFATLSEHGKGPDIGKPDRGHFWPKNALFSTVFWPFLRPFFGLAEKSRRG